jgi:Xaa-Pro dipeptidase
MKKGPRNEGRSYGKAPDRMVLEDTWSDLARSRAMPEIDFERLHAYRLGRLRAALKEQGAAMCLLVNPISLRYAVDYETYGLFQSHIPTTYLFLPQEGPLVIHGTYGPLPLIDEARPARAISFFDGGPMLAEAARLLADDVMTYLKEIGSDNRRVAIEYVNPSLTQALLQRGLEVIDGVAVAEGARVIKLADEIACMRWVNAVADLAIGKVKEALKPGVSENQLWALLNYANLANGGAWHDGRMLASGPRINPWCQEASARRVEAGDLVGLDTDMIGPLGYFADVSRTFHCGPAKPSNRQKQLYRLAYEEVAHNTQLVRPGITFRDFQQQAFLQDEAFHENAYSCVIHAVGMCDEYPKITPIFNGPIPYDGALQAGMVICVESYVGAKGERDGVKLEQQLLVTEAGNELLSTFPLEEALLG